jgi:hypothetical protein
MSVDPSAATRVKLFRQVLVWPLRLMPAKGQSEDSTIPWQILRDMGDASPWKEVVDEYTGAAGSFQERHYNEFVSFLPYVQRFLYGEGRSGNSATGESDSPMRVFRRKDVTKARVLTKVGAIPVELDVEHVDLYFFLNVNVVLLCVEVSATNISLVQAQDLLHRFGRGYPAAWEANGEAQHCMAGVQWVNAEGKGLANSDAKKKDIFFEHVSEHRAPRMSAHWAYLLEPLVSHHSDKPGLLRYRLIEYYRMPVMAYIAVDNPQRLTRGDYIRLGLVAGAPHNDDPDTPLPFPASYVENFEQQYCYDRYFVPHGMAPYTRFLCTGNSFFVIGDAHSDYFTDKLRGVLSQFRHQYFLLYVIAHFQKAALIMYSDRLIEALRVLNNDDPHSIRRFKRSIRMIYESFLGFTHRYWFRDVATQTQGRELFRMCADHLELNALYDEVKARTVEMSNFLETDSQYRQAQTVTRLTVVTIFGMIGTIVTGFLGMNLLAEAEAAMETKLYYFGLVTVVTSIGIGYLMIKSKKLSDFLDALTNEKQTAKDKWMAFLEIWEKDDD